MSFSKCKIKRAFENEQRGLSGKMKNLKVGVSGKEMESGRGFQMGGVLLKCNRRFIASKDVDPFKGQVLYEAEGIEGLQIQ